MAYVSIRLCFHYTHAISAAIYFLITIIFFFLPILMGYLLTRTDLFASSLPSTDVKLQSSLTMTVIVPKKC